VHGYTLAYETHDMLVHDEQVQHGVHDVLVIVVVCEYDGICKKHEGMVFIEFSSLKTYLQI